VLCISSTLVSFVEGETSVLDFRTARQFLPPSTIGSIRHPNYETLGLYVLGDLSLNTTLATEEHLSSCPRCKVQLQQVTDVVAALRA
jgi:hypothetical protein